MPRLFESIAIHGLSLKNRLVMPPMATAKADENGGVTDDTLNLSIAMSCLSCSSIYFLIVATFIPTVAT